MSNFPSAAVPPVFNRTDLRLLITQISSATAIAITIPSIDRDLGIEEDQAQWLVSAFSLVNVSFVDSKK